MKSETKVFKKPKALIIYPFIIFGDFCSYFVAIQHKKIPSVLDVLRIKARDLPSDLSWGAKKINQPGLATYLFMLFC